MALPFDVNYAPFSSPSSGTPNLGLTDSSVLDQLVAGLRAPARAPGSSVYFSPSQNAYHVGGKTISAQDEAALLSSGSSTDFNVGSPSPGGDFQPVDPQSFLGVLDKIANPDLMTRVGKNFESAVAGQGVLAGAGLKFLGLNGVGDSLLNVSQIREDQLAPYSMGLEDINGTRSHGPLDWFAGMVGQFGPSILAAALSSGIGALAGAASGTTAAGDALAGIGGVLARHAGKEVVQRDLAIAAKKYLAKQALSPAENQLLRSSAGQFAAALEKNPSFAQNILYAAAPGATDAAALTADQFAANAVKAGATDTLKRLGTQRIAGGAAVGAFANSLGTGVSDTYREQLQSGDPNAPNRAVALALGIPYAAMDFLPEYILARRVLGNIGADAAKKFMETQGIRQKAVTALKRGIKGAAVGGLLEGGNEAFQEMMLIAANPLVDLNSPEGISRVLNAFAGGAALGGAIGSFANLSDSHAPVDILNPTKNDVQSAEGPATPPEAPAPSGNDLAPLAPAPGGAGVAFQNDQTSQSIPYGEFSVPQDPQAIGQTLALPPPAAPNFDPANAYQNVASAQQIPQSINQTAWDYGQGQLVPNSPSPRAVDVLRRGAPTAPANVAGQAFNTSQMAPATQPGQVFSSAPSTPIMQADANGQGNLPLFGGRGVNLKRGEVQQTAVNDVLGANNPTQQGDLFNDRFPLIETPADASGIKARNIRQKNNIITWLNSLTDQEMAMLEPKYGAGDAILKVAKTTRSPAALLGEMKAILNNARETGKTVVKRGGKVVTLKVNNNPSPEDNPPQPPKPGAARLKKGNDKAAASSGVNKLKSPASKPASKASANGGSVASVSQSKVTEDFWKHYQSLVDDADLGTLSPLAELYQYANAKEDDNIPPEITKAAKDYFAQTVFSTKQQQRINELGGKVKEGPKSTTTLTSLDKLFAHLNAIIADPSVLNDIAKRFQMSGIANELYRMALLSNKAHVINEMAFAGKKLGDFFTNGKLNIQQITTNEGEDYVLADKMDGDTGRFYQTENDKEAHFAFDKGRVKFTAQAFAARFKVKPTIHVFNNMEDFRKSDPELYNRARNARNNRGTKEGERFDQAKSAGYSFAGKVILFADHIRSEQQLKFVLAHESIGHFGFRAIMGEAELTSALNHIYNSSREAKSIVDRIMETTGFGKTEAIEEFVADYAAHLDLGLLNKLWAVIKNALNKLGIRFDDDAARLLISQSKRYMRTGTGGFFSARALLDRMSTMEQEAQDGRFSMDDSVVASRWAAQAGITGQVLRVYDDISHFFTDGRLGPVAEGFRNKMASALEEVQTLNNIALRSEGLSHIFHLLQDQAAKAREYLADITEKLAVTNGMGVTAEHRRKAGLLKAYASMARGHLVDDLKLDEYPNLVTLDKKTGDINIDFAALAKLAKEGFVTADHFRAGLTVKDSLGGNHVFNFKDHGITEADLAEDSMVWKIYKEQSDAINLTAARVLASNYEQMVMEDRRVDNEMTRLFTVKPLEARDRETMLKIRDAYEALRMDKAETTGASITLDPISVQNADDFLKEVTTALVTPKDGESGTLAQWFEKGDTAYTKAAWKTRFPEVVSGLKSIYDKGVSSKQRFEVQKLIRNMALIETQVKDAERYAKKTILGSYTPLKRRGKYQVRIMAVDEHGRRVRLHESIRGALFYARTDDVSEAEQYVQNLKKIFKEDEYFDLPTADAKDLETATRHKVKLVPIREAARGRSEFADTINLNEFLFIAERYGVDFTPDVRGRLVEGLTAQNAAARANLFRQNAPGWDENVLRGIAEYLEAQSHVAAKRVFRLRLHDTLTTEALWTGDDQKLKSLKAAISAAPTDAARERAQREYDQYAFRYSYMAPPNMTVNIKGKDVQARGLGNHYRDKGAEIIDWMSSQTNVQDSTEDGLQGPWASRLKTFFVMQQLGGTFATAAINTVSMLTHSVPYLSWYNAKEGFGGGYGFGKSATHMMRAIQTVARPQYGNIARLEDMLSGKVATDLSKDELQYLLEETKGGILQAALPDALLGTARGKITDPRVRKGAEYWMSMFTYTERLNRRVTALATYRLEKQRALAEGLSEERAVFSARKAARDAVTNTQGEYGMINRPRMARGNLMSLVFVYKMFPVITVQLIKHLPVQSRVFMLGSLFLLAGIKGLPFADDLMDIIDTILQKLGLKAAPVEAQLYETLDGLTGGHGREFMRGWIDQFSGATFSTRFSNGDIIPLTGAFKAGADLGREMTTFLGPMAGGLFGNVNSASQLLSIASSYVTGKPSGLSLVDVMRQSPVALARAFGDAAVYADTGAVVNSRGQIISPGMNYLTLLSRVLGFYPSSATVANDFIRVGKQNRDYVNEITAAFKTEYIKAANAHGGQGDRAAMQQILQSIAQWNEAAKGTGFEIKDFRTSINKAVKAAKEPAGQRFLKTTPLAMRDRTSDWLELYGAQ